MSWIKTGTISVTNGSATVTGAGTSWVGTAQAGYGILMPNGLLYEIEGVVSDASITLAKVYEGTTQTGQAYAIVPTQGLTAVLVDAVNALMTNYQGVYDTIGQGKFPDGSLSAGGVRFTSDEDTGIRRTAANAASLMAGGADIIEWLSSSIKLHKTVTGDAVQSSATDTTAGVLLTLGAFGLGNLSGPPLWPNTSLNDCTGVGAGIYGVNGDHDLDGRLGAVGVVYFTPRINSLNQFVQTFYTTSGEIYNRASNGGTIDDPVWDWQSVLRSTTGGITTINGAVIQALTITIADDAVGEVEPKNKGGYIFLSSDNDNDYPGSVTPVVAWFDVGTSSACFQIFTAARGAVSTGAMTGTTGTDDYITVSAHSDGKLYIENRSGQSRKYTIHILG
ncbi:hypothetical protein [Thalassovita sp.]|uniref:hypothetical protein n=1 Tax=Thalassovita sp. TaxID=1979401 RepID=UPI002B2721DA|nr:hypothetical protein [Thalassovita sp.]